MLPDPTETRKYVGEKFPLPHGGGGCRGREGGRWRAALGRCFWPVVRAPSESRRYWLKINSATRVGPDSCARTANMDAHQVLLAGRCGGSRRELVGRAGSSGRGKKRRKGRRRRRSGRARSPRGEGCPAHPGRPYPAPPTERMLRGVGRAGPFCQTLSFRSTPRFAHFTLPIPKKFFKRSLRQCPGHLAATRVPQAGTRDVYLRPGRVLGS